MDANDYQKQAHDFAMYKDNFYPILGLAKVAKHLRSVGRINADSPDTDLAQKIKAELGDCVWMCSEIASLYGWDLSDVMEQNIAKLTDRRNRDVICGEGDTTEERIANAKKNGVC